jgi:hypothetical protein
MKFYTYMWLRKDGYPYYVGKGRKNRAYVKHGKNFNPPSKDRVLIQEYLSEEDALAAEAFFISYYGRKDLGKGCLKNLTDGGENPPNRRGKTASKETREKISTTLMGNTRGLGYRHTPSALIKIGIFHKGKSLSKEHIEKIRHSKKGIATRPKDYRHSEETKEKIRIKALEREARKGVYREGSNRHLQS